LRPPELASLLVLAVACAACGERESGPPPAFRGIVLVTIDTLRADHLGAYGYPFGTSAFLDELAERSVVFDRAYAAISVTLPSHATLFTSLYPIQHRVLKNSLRLDGSHWTLAELLAEAGFDTGGFASMREHFAVGGLAQGFDVFDEPGPAGPEDLPYRPADATVDRALAWVRSIDADRRFFLWVHVYDPHQPLAPPEAHRESVAPSDAEARAERIRFLREQHHVSRGAGHDGQPVFRRGDEGMLALHTAYDGEVHFVDAELRRLFAGVAAAAGDADTLWVVTSDHGEGLGSHAYKFHGRHIYEEQIRVPLLIHATAGDFAPARVDAVVEHVDLLPTVAALAGVPPASLAREPRMQGRSLWPLLRGGGTHGADDERAAFAQRRHYAAADRRSPLVRRDFEVGRKFAWIEPRYKLIHRSTGEVELFDLERDPYETHDLSVLEPERVASMRARLLERVAELEASASGEPESVDDATIERLRALGYAP